MEQIFKQLRVMFMQEYIGHFKDDYEGQNKLSRNANIYAVKNTKRIWEAKSHQLGGILI